MSKVVRVMFWRLKLTPVKALQGQCGEESLEMRALLFDVVSVGADVKGDVIALHPSGMGAENNAIAGYGKPCFGGRKDA